jgi:carboxypeptidase PM20D1
MKAFKSVLIIACVLLAVLIIRALLHTPTLQIAADPVEISLDQELLVSHLAESIQFPTISYGTLKSRNSQAFEGFQTWVSQTYQHLHHRLELTKFNDTLLYLWQGSDPTLQPILLTGHYDVVHVIPGTEKQWKQPPFSGNIEGGYVWGRGALDDKSGVVGILEAVNYLLAQDFQPKRSIYLSFGHDEEIGGNDGAALVAEYLKRNQIQLAWSLDEGSFLLDGFIPGVNRLVAAVNVAEKGSTTLQIVGTAEGGHSSMPPKQTAVGVLAEAMTKLENNPLHGGLEGLSLAMFDTISRDMPFALKLLFANRWLFGGLIDRFLSQDPSTNAMLRTTTAPTMLSASVKPNVLPIEAVATVNFRIHPRDTVEDVFAHVEKIVQDDKVEVRPMNWAGFGLGQAASRVSSWESDGYGFIENSIRGIFGDVIVAPGLMVAASDSRHYGKVADNAYRFNPFPVSKDQLTGFHGTNERINAESFIKGVKVYIRLIEQGSSQ